MQDLNPEVSVHHLQYVTSVWDSQPTRKFNVPGDAVRIKTCSSDEDLRDYQQVATQFYQINLQLQNLRGSTSSNASLCSSPDAVSAQNEQYSIPPLGMTMSSAREKETDRISTGNEAREIQQYYKSSDFNPSSSATIDVAFLEDARWKGVHPSNLNPKDAVALDKQMPSGFQYARDLQPELVFIPPVDHERRSPGSMFVLQKRGSGAIPIITPSRKAAKGCSTQADNSSIVVRKVEKKKNNHPFPSDPRILTSGKSSEPNQRHESPYGESSPTTKLITMINNTERPYPASPAKYTNIPPWSWYDYYQYKPHNHSQLYTYETPYGIDQSHYLVNHNPLQSALAISSKYQVGGYSIKP
ncbi:hypothetical protein LTS08_004994 [Lithohypha guttulata]|nr:hypothetical protein LTS08_004994 [Lithohypha guttulata]